MSESRALILAIIPRPVECVLPAAVKENDGMHGKKEIPRESRGFCDLLRRRSHLSCRCRRRPDPHVCGYLGGRVVVEWNCSSHLVSSLLFPEQTKDTVRPGMAPCPFVSSWSLIFHVTWSGPRPYVFWKILTCEHFRREPFVQRPTWKSYNVAIKLDKPRSVQFENQFVTITSLLSTIWTWLHTWSVTCRMSMASSSTVYVPQVHLCIYSFRVLLLPK